MVVGLPPKNCSIIGMWNYEMSLSMHLVFEGSIPNHEANGDISFLCAKAGHILHVSSL